MDCPNCKLINPPGADRCDCGYRFGGACPNCRVAKSPDLTRCACGYSFLTEVVIRPEDDPVRQVAGALWDLPWCIGPPLLSLTILGEAFKRPPSPNPPPKGDPPPSAG